jgi:hypothetical protein
MFKVKVKNNYWDVVLGNYLNYFVPPFGYILLGLVVYLFWRVGGQQLLQQKMYFKAGVLLLDDFLFELVLFLFISILIVFVIKLGGRLRLTNLEHELEFTEEGYTGRTAESEYKTLSKNIARFAETRKRVLWYNNNNALEIYPKSCFSTEELHNLIAFFKPKRSLYLEWVCKYGFLTFWLLVALLAWLLLYPRYSVIRNADQFTAFSADNQTVVEVNDVAMGRVERLIDEIHPFLAFLVGRPDIATANEHNFFLLKDGMVKTLPLLRLYRSEAYLNALGDDLYLIREKGNSDCKKFGGDDFQVVDCKQIDVYQKSCEDTGYKNPKWKRFTRWDEGTEEEENPEAAQRYTASFNPNTKPIQIEWDKPAMTERTTDLETKYSWKSSLGTGVLIDISPTPQYISHAQYKELFPKEAHLPMGDEGGNQ